MLPSTYYKETSPIEQDTGDKTHVLLTKAVPLHIYVKVFVITELFIT